MPEVEVTESAVTAKEEIRFEICLVYSKISVLTFDWKYRLSIADHVVGQTSKYSRRIKVTSFHQFRLFEFRKPTTKKKKEAVASSRE